MREVVTKEDADALAITLLIIFLGMWICLISLFCDGYRRLR